MTIIHRNSPFKLVERSLRKMPIDQHIRKLNGARRQLGLHDITRANLNSYVKQYFGKNIKMLLDALYNSPGKLDVVLRREKSTTLDPIYARRRAEKRERYEQRRESRRLAVAISKGNGLRDLLTLEKINTNVKTSEKSGFVYILTNPVWPSWVKIGSTLRLDERLSSFNNADPHAAYFVEYFDFVADRGSVEREMHLQLNTSRGCGEWFNIEPSVAIQILKKIVRSKKNMLTSVLGHDIQDWSLGTDKSGN